jgi:hypothetical protein
MFNRFKLWLFLFGVAFTQGVFNTTLAGLYWVITGDGLPPDPDEPLSSRVGRYSMEGRRWAIGAEKIIDGIFGKGHCRASAEYHLRKCECI